MLDYRLETFLNLCETMSYTRTARRLNMTQPAVTQHIHSLEKAYGAVLFTYSHKTLALTEKGLLLRRYARSLRANSEYIAQAMRAGDEGRPSLRFGATLTIGETIMPPILQKLLDIRPQTDISMQVQNTQVLLDALQRGHIDFAVIEGNFDRREYESRRFCEEPFIGVCAPDSPLAARTVALDDLTGERLVLRERGSGTRNVLETVLFAHNLSTAQFSGLLEIGNFPAIKRMVRNGCGISFMYRAAACQDLKDGTLAELSLRRFQVSRAFNFVFLRDSVVEPQILAFFAFSQKVLQSIQKP